MPTRNLNPFKEIPGAKPVTIRLPRGTEMHLVLKEIGHFENARLDATIYRSRSGYTLVADEPGASHVLFLDSATDVIARFSPIAERNGYDFDNVLHSLKEND